MIERGVSGDGCEPGFPAAAFWIKLVDLVPNAQGHFCEAIFLILRIWQDRCNDVAHEWPIMQRQGG